VRCLVTDIRPETPDTQTFRFDAQLEFKAGQAIALVIPGDPKKRFYSMSSSPTEKGSIAITIKADDKTRPLFGSLFSLKPGSPVDIEGPVGSFALPDTLEGPFYFLAGGSGVTPFRSMIKYILDTRPTTEQWLFHSAKDPDDLIFKEELLAWSKNTAFHYIPTFTRWDSPDQKAETGRIGEALLRRHLPLMKGLFFLCGPSEFVAHMEHILTTTFQVSPAQIRREQWGK
jgi:ferredoxin-NADP reductase